MNTTHTKVSLAFLAALGLATTSAFADGLGTKAGTTGDWTIYLDKDAMTDAITCVGIYKGRPEVQITTTSLAFSLRGRGGVSSYRYRLDDNPPSDLQIATDIQKETDGVVFEGDVFNQINQAHRFRIQFLTILGSQVTEDIDLKTLAPAIAFMQKQGCKS